MWLTPNLPGSAARAPLTAPASSVEDPHGRLGRVLLHALDRLARRASTTRQSTAHLHEPRPRRSGGSRRATVTPSRRENMTSSTGRAMHGKTFPMEHGAPAGTPPLRRRAPAIEATTTAAPTCSVMTATGIGPVQQPSGAASTMARRVTSRRGASMPGAARGPRANRA